MRQIIPYIFWPWFATSCFILLRRRVSGGSWKAIPDEPEERAWAPPPLPAESTLDQAPPTGEAPASAESATVEPVPDPTPEPEPEPEPTPDESAPAEALPTTEAAAERPAGEPAPAAVMTDVRSPSRTLAEALEGIAMPCDLAPLIGSGEVNHREVAFFTSGFNPTTVGEGLADEFERLGYEITPVDDRTIRAIRHEDVVRATLLSEALVGEAVMTDLHPSAPAGALVVELKLA